MCECLYFDINRLSTSNRVTIDNLTIAKENVRREDDCRVYFGWSSNGYATSFSSTRIRDCGRPDGFTPGCERAVFPRPRFHHGGLRICPTELATRGRIRCMGDRCEALVGACVNNSRFVAARSFRAWLAGTRDLRGPCLARVLGDFGAPGAHRAARTANAYRRSSDWFGPFKQGSTNYEPCDRVRTPLRQLCRRESQHRVLESTRPLLLRERCHTIWPHNQGGVVDCYDMVCEAEPVVYDFQTCMAKINCHADIASNELRKLGASGVSDGNVYHRAREHQLRVRDGLFVRDRAIVNCLEMYRRYTLLVGPHFPNCHKHLGRPHGASVSQDDHLCDYRGGNA